MTVSLPDYATVKASRSPEYNRKIATHEIGHCLVARALGSIVDLVTIIPDGMFAGRCVRRGVPSPSLAFVDESTAVDAADAESITQPTTENIVSVCAKIGAPEVGSPRVAMAEEMARAIVRVTELVAARCCERIFYPDHEPLPAEHDYIEAHALASHFFEPGRAHSLLRGGGRSADPRSHGRGDRLDRRSGGAGDDRPRRSNHQRRRRCRDVGGRT